MNLREKTLTGVFWAFSQQFSVQFINFGVQIVLARLLLPEAFGLIAMIQIFVAIGESLMDGGMTSSLIRTPKPNQRDYSTVFFINLFSSILIYFVLFVTAPAIGSFFNQTLLTPIIRIYTLSFIIQSLVGVHTTLLTKAMNFKLQMYMQIPSVIVGGIVGIILAFRGYGVWSLVWMKLVTTFLFMAQHWFRTKWRPNFLIDMQKLKFHFNFGYKLTLSSLLTSIYSNSYTFIIGKFFSPAQLGFYNQANTLRTFPVSNITRALEKVTYPAFSSIQNDNDKLRSVFKRITSAIFFIITPVMLFLVVIAEPLFRFVLTEKWLPAVQFFQVLCISSIIYPLSMYNLNIILAKGRSGLYLKLEIIKKVGSILLLLLIFPFGIWGAVYAQAISMFIHAFVNMFYSGRMINYPVRKQIIDILPMLGIGLFSMITCYLLDAGLRNKYLLSDISRLAIGVGSYFFVYLGFSYLTKVESVLEIKKIITTYKASNGSK